MSRLVLVLSVLVALGCGGLFTTAPPDWLGDGFGLSIASIEGDRLVLSRDVSAEQIAGALRTDGWRAWRISRDEAAGDRQRFERAGVWVDVFPASRGEGPVVALEDVQALEIPADEPARILDPVPALERAPPCTRRMGGQLRLGIGSFTLSPQGVVGGWEIRDGSLLFSGRRPDGADFDRTCANARVIGVTGAQLIACRDAVFAFCGVERGPVFEVRNAGGGRAATEMVARALMPREPGIEEEGGGLPFVFVGEPAKKPRKGVVLRHQDADPLVVDWAERMAYRIRRDVGAEVVVRHWEDAPIDYVVYVGAGTLPSR